jgi:hypothetical protein
MEVVGGGGGVAKQEARDSAFGADENKPRPIGVIFNVVAMDNKLYVMPQFPTIKYTVVNIYCHDCRGTH